jgi:protein CMS1
MVNHGGDDLEDDFIPDDLVAFSEGEDGNYLDIADAFADDGEVEGEVYGDVADTEPTAAVADAGNVDKKRKRREKAKDKKAKVNIVLAFTPISLLTFMAEKKQTGRRGGWQ